MQKYYFCINPYLSTNWNLYQCCHKIGSRSITQGLPSPFPKQAMVFKCLQYKSFENSVGKGEIAHNEQFLLFPQSFQPIWRTFFNFQYIQNCRLRTLSVWQSLKFVVWERVKKNARLWSATQCSWVDSRSDCWFCIVWPWLLLIARYRSILMEKRLHI